MQKLMDQNIKDIIHRFPQVGQLLKEHDVACVECNVGTCMLRDIMEIHNLDPEQEREVMQRIASIVYPGQDVHIPAFARKPREKTKKLAPPLEKLVREHKLIKQLIGFIPELIQKLETEPKPARELLREALDFIRFYADQFHHAKEENVLFKYFDENAEIFQVMLLDHDQARGYVRDASDALNQEKDEIVCQNLKDYGELLREHIKKEDEVLYPWIDLNITVSQVGRLHAQFQSVDEQFGTEPLRWEQFINRLEEMFSHEDVIKIEK